MSFGFSVGDFLAGAQLAYTLCKALSDAKGSAKEFQELITELDVVHKVLLQVDQLRATNQLAQPTINALLFTVNSANETMESFLDQSQPYLDSLKAGGSRFPMVDAYRKMKWPFHMADRVLLLLFIPIAYKPHSDLPLGEGFEAVTSYNAGSCQLPRFLGLLL